MTLPFTPRLTPNFYQSDFLTDHGEDAAWGLFWEQGTGKTKALIDDAALLLGQGKVDGMAVVAPSGVHRNWHVEELPKQWPGNSPPYESFCWDTTRASTKSHAAEYLNFLMRTDPQNAGHRFGVLCMSYDGLMTDLGKQSHWDFVRRRRVIACVDESHRIKTPDAKRQKRMLASSVYAPYRRIASGTPMDKPFDVYSQVRYLDADFWMRELGIGSFTAFKTHFGNWTTATTAAGHTFPMLKRDPYRNLDELEAALSRISSRITKEAAGLGLPPKTYKRVFHPLTSEQRRVYSELKDEAMSFLASGELITSEMALILQLRLKQVGCGFITPSAGAEPVPFALNPRATALRGLLEGTEGPTIVWAEFQHDVSTCEAVSRGLKRRPVVYDGNHPERSIDPWKAGEADDLIANLSSGMIEGYTLVRADTVIYYSNTRRLITRQQSEDRAHRIGQARSVTYIDLLAERTQDARLLDGLRGKGLVSGEVLGDDPVATLRWLLAEDDTEEEMAA